MKFYDRETELQELHRLDDLSHSVSQFTVLIGRRRTGKTTLLVKAFENKKYLYCFVGKKSEQILCQEFQQQIETVLGIHIYGQAVRFSALLNEVMQYSRQQQVTLIIDEFQRLMELDESIISQIQNVWDQNQNDAHIHLIACGSIYSMMKRIFEDRKEPLFGRKTARIVLKPFSISTLKQIFHDYNLNYTAEDLLMLYAITGGVAKYVAQLMESGCKTWNDMIQTICNPSSVFIEEGTELLVGEFGKRYQIYYSILQLIANGMTSQSEIDSIVEKNTGRYLETLETDYSLIRKMRPIWSKPNSQGIKYYIEDNFLCFWFRFIESNRSLVELGKFDLLAKDITQNYPQFSGLVLEKYFRQLYGEKPDTTEVGNWWASDGKNEIDLIAIEKLNKRAVVAEVKRNPERYDARLLEEKCEKIKKNLHGFQVELMGLSLKDM